MRLRCTTVLPGSVARMVAELAKPALLDQVAAPMLIFDPVDPPVRAKRWTLGPHRFRLRVAGRVPIGEHTIDVRRVLTAAEEPTPADPIVWHDAGHSDLIKVWDHRIALHADPAGVRYTDLVEIHAGVLTLPCWLFARAFYRHRQRRLARLAADGFAY